ncbi:MAG: Txe/YoeB family addiction module toxin [Candidatus Omnitrophota bacterium]
MKTPSTFSNRVNWKIAYTKQAQRDAKKLSESGLRSKAGDLLEILSLNPFQPSPPFEKLVGDLEGAYSRRINIQHRLVYQVIKKSRTVKILRMWTHYE